MVIHRITMTSKGQFTMPAEIRRQLRLKPQDQLTVSVVDGNILLKPDKLTLEDVIGSLPSPPGIETGDFEAIIDQAIEEESRRLTEEFLALSKE